MTDWTVTATVTIHIESDEPPGDADVASVLVPVGDVEIEDVVVVTVEEAY